MCSVCQKWKTPILVGLCRIHQDLAMQFEREARTDAARHRHYLLEWRRDHAAWLENEARQNEARAYLYYGACAWSRFLNYKHYRYFRLTALMARKLSRAAQPQEPKR